MSRTTCKLIGEDIVYRHVHVYTRDLSVNRLLMRRAVLINKIMAFVCIGEIITNVFAHARGGGGRNISGLRTCSDANLRMRHLLAK